MEIRPASPEDVASIARVHVEGWQVGYPGLLPQHVLDALHPDQRVPRWTDTVARARWPGRGVLVAEDAGAIIGFADIRPTEDDDQDPVAVGEVASFYVAPAAWRTGVGRRLMTTALDRLAEAGRSRATLWVQAGNVRAIAFYRALDFIPDGAAMSHVVGGASIRDLRYGRPTG